MNACYDSDLVDVFVALCDCTVYNMIILAPAPPTTEQTAET